MSEPPAVLRYGGNDFELPVVTGTESEHAIDIAKLRSETGLITLDYGYMNTGSTESAITYIDSDDPKDPEQVQLSIVRLMAKLPTIAAYSYKKSIGQPFLYPDNSLDLIENFLTMMFAVPSEPYEVSPTIVHALKQILILHADHEQNCSTSTVRMVGSAEANLFASIAAGINALWGPLHGGANQAVI